MVLLHKSRFSAAKIFLVTALSFSIISCKKNTPDTTPLTAPVSNPGMPIPSSRIYLALGDSYTIGQSVSANDRFPNQAAAILNRDGLLVAAPNIIATTGWTTGNLLSSLSSNPPAKNFDFVTLLIGVNNQFQGRTLDEYKSEFQNLLGMSISYAGGQKKHVFVLSIPDYSVTPFASGMDRPRIAREIDEFNAAARQICVASDISFLDITGISRETDPALIAADGLHPSGKQYARWAALLAPLMKAAL